MNLRQIKVPEQKVLSRNKTSRWAKDCVEGFIELAGHTQNNANRRDRIYEYYEAYNGQINDSYYTHVTKPFGKTRPNFPARLHRYNIIKPLVDQLTGEKAKRNLDYHVIVTNPDVENRMIQEKTQLLTQLIQLQYMNALAAEGVPTGVDPQPTDQMAQQVAEFEENYQDKRAINGQQALEYIVQYNEFYHQSMKGFKDFLISGEVCSYRAVEHNEPVYRILNPLDVEYDMDPDLEFIEDGDWALMRQYMHVSSVLDRYHDVLTEEEIAELESGVRHKHDNFFHYNPHGRQQIDIAHEDYVEVIQVYWRSMRKIGFVEWLDPDSGELLEKVVEEDYVLNRNLGERVEWMWVAEVWEGHRINGVLYKRLRALDNQRGSLDNMSSNKLPINGRRYSDRNAVNISMVSLALPYQITYDIYKYRLEISIAKSKDVIGQIDLSMIPKDWDVDKFLYYMESTGIAFVDYNKEGERNFNPQHVATMDLTVKTIEQYIRLLESIVVELERLAGITRQRQGQLTPYDGKATTEQSIVQSSHITEDYFRLYSWMEQRDLQALMDYSRPAWIYGKKSTYFMDDEGMKILSLDGLEHASSEYAVFVKDAREESHKIQAARMLTQTLAQAGTPASQILAILDSNHFRTIRRNVKKAEQINQELQAALQQQEQANQEAQRQLELEKIERQSMDKALDREKDVQVALIRAEPSYVDVVKAELENNKTATQAELEQRKIDLENRKLQVEAALKREEMAIKRAELARRPAK
jgi:hypothetical protein